MFFFTCNPLHHHCNCPVWNLSSTLPAEYLAEAYFCWTVLFCLNKNSSNKTKVLNLQISQYVRVSLQYKFHWMQLTDIRNYNASQNCRFHCNKDSQIVYWLGESTDTALLPEIVVEMMKECIQNQQNSIPWGKQNEEMNYAVQETQNWIHFTNIQLKLIPRVQFLFCHKIQYFFLLKLIKTNDLTYYLFITIFIICKGKR